MRKILFYLFVVISMTGCSMLNPSIMLKTPKDYQYAKLTDSLSPKEYKISPNDIVDFRMYTNDGFKLVDLASLNTTGTSATAYQATTNYIVEYDGFVKLPIIGRVKISGLTIREAELMLEQKYTPFYVKPFVLVKVTNERVIVFPGDPGLAKVIPLENSNTTLLEALALAGGISENGKAWKVKLIRGNADDYKVYLIDLSKIDGLKQGEMILQANDLIYVEPRRNTTLKLLTELTPYLTLISTLFVTYALIKSLK
ncbi:MAG: polysaccharide biosynthesis/export family protein [Bacteroidia bacterium]